MTGLLDFETPVGSTASPQGALPRHGLSGTGGQEDGNQVHDRRTHHRRTRRRVDPRQRAGRRELRHYPRRRSLGGEPYPTGGTRPGYGHARHSWVAPRSRTSEPDAARVGLDPFPHHLSLRHHLNAKLGQHCVALIWADNQPLQRCCFGKGQIVDVGVRDVRVSQDCSPKAGTVEV